MAFCTNCGAKLQDDAKFCHACGAPNSHSSVGRQAKREYEYAGKIIKCPGCGETLASFQTTCPTCGYEIREGKASSAVREFAEKLEAIESRRKSEKKWGYKKANENGLSFVDEQKISLISSFPIPNTKEDLFEFFTMAASNVNDRRYSGELTPSQAAVSDAWEAKFEQAYQKALLAVHTPVELASFQKLYTQKTTALSQSKKDAQKAEKSDTVQQWLFFLFAVAFLAGCVWVFKYL